MCLFLYDIKESSTNAAIVRGNLDNISMTTSNCRCESANFVEASTTDCTGGRIIVDFVVVASANATCKNIVKNTVESPSSNSETPS